MKRLTERCQSPKCLFYFGVYSSFSHFWTHKEHNRVKFDIKVQLKQVLSEVMIAGL